MDPNKALADLRELVAEAYARHDKDECDSGCEWAECFDALDESMSAEGFLPTEWAYGR